MKTPEIERKALIADGINVPDEIAAAFESLNNAIRNCGNPLCYYPSNIAATVKEE